MILTPPELILALLIAIILVLGLHPPKPVASVLDSLFGKIGIFMVVVYVFLHHSPLLGILFLFLAFDLVRRSSSTVIGLPSVFETTEENKVTQMLSLIHI